MYEIADISIMSAIFLSLARREPAQNGDSMFVDTALITVKAGKGGNGLVSFHREKYVPAGGPDGGDGGRGGNIVFVSDNKLTTLMDFRYRKVYSAQNGQDGKAGKCSGKAGEDTIIRVPEGTLIRDTASGKILADMTGENKTYVAARGGNGGWGNVHFATPVRQAPKIAKPGQLGQEREITLELKLLADVALVGFPNVGKSTLISRVSSARPKIANYHFTTLAPNLGVVSVHDKSFVIADVPGLIEGAHTGAGLGHEFLRHIERTRIIIHVVDAAGTEGRDPIEDFEAISRELELFNPELLLRPQLVAGNKTDIPSEKQGEFEAFVTESGYKYFPISAATGQGVDALMNQIAEMLDYLPPIPVYEAEEIEEEEIDYMAYEIKEEDHVYTVEGPYVDKLLRGINFGEDESVHYFQRAIKSRGIIDALREKGIQEGDTVVFGEMEFDFVE